MPNWTKNVLTMKRLCSEDLFNEDSELDFGEVVPMPEKLNIEEGSRANFCILYYLTEKNTKPVKKRQSETSSGCELEEYRIPSGEWIPKSSLFPSGCSNSTLTEREISYEEERLDDDYILGKQYVENVIKYDARTWFYWCLKNWGTKWNACETNVRDNDTVSFESAWNMPQKYIEALSLKYPDREIIIEWIDEDEIPYDEESGVCLDDDAWDWHSETYLNGETI